MESIANLNLSDVVKVTARERNAAFDGLGFQFVKDVKKEARADVVSTIGAFVSVMNSTRKAYYNLAVLAAAITEKESYKALINPDTGKPYSDFKEMCLSSAFSAVMTNEKGDALSYSFVSQLSSVGKFFYLPALRGDERYSIFEKASISALIQFLPVTNTDAFPALLTAFNADGEKPALYDISKMSVNGARELKKRMENRENILLPPAETADAKPADADAKPADAKPQRRNNKGRKASTKPADAKPAETPKADAKPADAKPADDTPKAADDTPKADFFVVTVMFNDGRKGYELPAQTWDDYKNALHGKAFVYKNVLILNGHSTGKTCAFGVMVTPCAKPDKYDVSAAVSADLQMCGKLYAEFLKPAETADAKPAETADAKPADADAKPAETDADADTDDKPF